jgi:hypothetical protein
VLLTVAPLYRILPLRETGIAGEEMAALSAITSGVLWWGSLLALLPAIILARLIRPHWLEAGTARVVALLLKPRIEIFAFGLAVISGLLGLVSTLYILEGKPLLIDATAQLLHARYLAAGRLAGPVLPDAVFWHIQNTIITPNGWVSQYPPGHIILLAAGFRLGAVWIIGPVLTAVTIFFTALSAERLLPANRAVARFGVLLAAISPFLIGLASAYMNHITAAAFGTMAIYMALRARAGSALWAVPTGGALAWTLGTRPLSALAFGAVIAFGIWIGGGERGRPTIRQWLRWFGAACAGAAPFMVALGTYNAHFFGSPFRFGYSVALGPATSLGFHRDPWGNWYGPLEALAYTSTDLLALSLNLLETPIPIVPLVGVFILFARRLTGGERIIAAWALLPVLANVSYWHHGHFMGPRMLNEAAPAWAILAAVAAVGVVRLIPEGHYLLRPGYSSRIAVGSYLVMGAVIGVTVLAPMRLVSHGGDWQASTRLKVEASEELTLVFIHGGWSARAAMMLAASGMRLDSVETALRQNSTCKVFDYATALYAGTGASGNNPGAMLDFNPRSRDLPPLVGVSPGNPIRVDHDEQLHESCMREVYADRNGVIDVSPFVWQGDLPGMPAQGTLYVRDMGPDLNSRLIRRFPERTPILLYVPSLDSKPELVPYDEGIALLWSELPGGEQQNAR